jgi:hypothetical protein
MGIRPEGFRRGLDIAEKPPPAVFAEVAAVTRVCAYDRPGTPVGDEPSRSDPMLF